MTIKDNKVIFNISEGKGNYSQRNNEIDPHNTCGPTNMVQAMDYMGYKLPNIFPNYEQYDDKFTNFCLVDKRVLEYYKKNFKSYYEKWIVKADGYYNPFEIHDVLSYAANLFLGFDATSFSAKCPIYDIIEEVVIHNRPVVTSGCFAGLNHIVTIVGFEFDKTYYDLNKKRKDWVKTAIPLNVIIDDTYGQTYNYKAGKSGNDTVITWKQFIDDVKPLKDSKVKYAHKFKK